MHTSDPGAPRLTVPVGVHEGPVAQGDEDVHGSHDVGEHPRHLHEPRHGRVHNLAWGNRGEEVLLVDLVTSEGELIRTSTSANNLWFPKNYPFS